MIEAHWQQPDLQARRAVLRVDPHSIELVYRGTDHRQMIHHRGAAIDGEWDRNCYVGFERAPVFRAISDVVLAGKRWDQTHFFQARLPRIRAGVRQFGCSTEEEWRARGEYIRQLYERIREDGYRSQAELGTPRSLDEIRVAIDRRGRLIFLDGRHRFSIAKLLELDSIPVHVAARHVEWHAFKQAVTEVAERRGGLLRQPIDHPDLAALPSEQGTERRDVVRSALTREGVAGGTLIDLNPEWGYHVHQFASAGYRCTAVIDGPSAWYARRLQAAANASFRLVEGPPVTLDGAHCDILLALDGPKWITAGAPPEAAAAELVARLRPAVAFVEPRVLATGERLPDDRAAAGSVQALAAKANMRSVGVCGRSGPLSPIFMLRRDLAG